jgi:hypothetical protein
MEKKRPIYYERKKETATPKNTSKPKKKGPDCFCFCFCSTPFFFNGQRHQTKRKIKEKEKRSPDPGHYWPDMDSGLDPGHLGPNFDSGSGLASAFTDPSPGAALKHGLFGLFTDFLWTFRTRCLPGRYAKVCGCEGGNCFRQNLG